MKKQVVKDTWKLMSKFVRLRDKNICFTCGKYYEVVHAGHFKHAPKSNQVSYDPRNINCQCISCNSFKNGCLDIYAEKLIKKYNPETLEELSRLKFEGRTMPKQWFLDKQEEIKGWIEALDKGEAPKERPET